MTSCNTRSTPQCNRKNSALFVVGHCLILELVSTLHAHESWPVTLAMTTKRWRWRKKEHSQNETAYENSLKSSMKLIYLFSFHIIFYIFHLFSYIHLLKIQINHRVKKWVMEVEVSRPSMYSVHPIYAVFKMCLLQNLRYPISWYIFLI